MRREVSDLHFKEDIIHMFFSDYSHIYSDEVMYATFANKVFLVDTYSYLWVYREVAAKAAAHGITEPDSGDVNALIAMALALYPDLEDRKVDLTYNFRDFVEMGPEHLATYAIQLLEDV